MRFSPRTAGWTGVLTLVLLGTVAAQEPEVENSQKVEKNVAEKKASPPFTVSKETTGITEPLKPDGSVDFVAAVNARNSRGVTPENNAGVLLMQLFGAESVPEAHREAFYKGLGVAAPEQTGGLLQNFSQFISQDKEQQKLFDQQSEAMRRPWSRKEFPKVADWLDANAQAIERAIEASNRPRLFFPLVAQDKQSLIDAAMQGQLQQMRAVTRLLSANAMRALGEGRLEEAETNLLACHRLARLMGRRAPVIEVLVSYAIDATASQGDRALAMSNKVTAEQLSAYRKKLAELPPLADMSEAIDQGERLFGLGMICHLATHADEDSAKALGLPKDLRRMLGLTVDWDLILKGSNTQYDKMVAALRQPTYAERAVAIDEIETDLKKLREEAKQPAQILFTLLGADPPRAVVSRQLGNVLMATLVPAIRQSANAETRAQARHEMTLLALALAEYQRDKGTYPETLNALAPQYLKTISQDPFTGETLKYQRQEKGYLLYTVGPNGKDDQSQQHNAQNPDADDWAIRVPEMPEL